MMADIDDGGRGLGITDDIFPDMAIWAFIVIVVSAIIFIVITILFFKIRKMRNKRRLFVKRKLDKSNTRVLTVEESNHKTKNESIPGEESNLGFEPPMGDLPVAKQKVHDEQTETQTNKTKASGDEHVDSEGQETGTVTAEKDGAENAPPGVGLGTSTSHGPDDEDDSEIYAQPDQIRKVDHRSVEGPDNSVKHPHAPGGTTYSQPDELDKPGDDDTAGAGADVLVLREAAPGSDVLYAVPMKKSLKKSSQKEEAIGGTKSAEKQKTDGDTGKKPKGEIKLGEITLPQASSMGSGTASLYEEVDLSAVAMATMSEDEDTPRTEL